MTGLDEESLELSRGLAILPVERGEDEDGHHDCDCDDFDYDDCDYDGNSGERCDGE